MPALAIGPTTVPPLEAATAPPHPSLPAPLLAVQLVAFDVVQLSVVDWPAVMVVGNPLNVSIVAGGVTAPTATVTLAGEPTPPGPEQTSV